MTASETPTRTDAPSARARLTRLAARPAWAGLLTFAAGAAASLGVAGYVEAQWQTTAHARFERRAAHLSTAIQRELLASAVVLSGARGALTLSPAPTRNAWRAYVANLDLDGNRAPVRILGYATAQADGSGPPAALPIAVQGFAPDTGALPPDIGARDAAALWRAADSGQIALAVRDTDTDRDTAGQAAALTLFLPLYRAGVAPVSRDVRRAALAGFLFASLDTQRLFELATADERGIGLSVSHRAPGTPLYRADAGMDATASAAPWRTTGTLAFGGDTLTLAYAMDGRPGATGATDLWAAVLAAGLAVSAALAAALYRLARLRERSPDTSATPNEARMMGIIRSSMEAIITIDEAQTVVIFNPMAERVFGVSAMEAIGAPLSRFIPERFRAVHVRHVEQFGVTGVSERQMGRQRVLFGLRANGEEFPIEASISQIRDGTGKLYTVMLRDITERLRGEDALRQSREELRELSANLQNVREEEKTRIARELHDDLGQQLTALKMDLSALGHALHAPSTGGRAAPSVPDQLRGMHRLIDSTVASVRRIAADLRPVMLDDLGLVPAIEWLAQDFTHRYGIEVECHVEPGETGFNSVGATTLFRIVQEALTNVARHADATRVRLTLRLDEDACVLSIADNGRGAYHGEPAQGRVDKSFGLIGIRERAHMLGGTVTIDTGRGRGFAITVAFPLQSIQQETSLS
ncbi:PAS domain S-box protein [Burkholderia alba]|uniref:PAS domain S-box protein n=1 Tax=Burkholderia alba TaxID=2683677 RepID=UPI002B0529A4|nr:PAS domain S-box protein [Burkholderia alba]